MLRQHPLTPWLGALGLHALLLVMFQTRADPTQPPVPLVTEVVMLAAEAAPTPPAPAPKQPQVRPEPQPSKPLAKPRPSAPLTPSRSPLAQGPSVAQDSSPDPAPATPPAAKPTPASGEPGPEKETPPAFSAAYLSNPEPSYPPASLELGESGGVLLRVVVSADGQPTSVEVARSSGFGRLDRAAVAAVKRWRFTPARRGSEAMAGTVLVPINFQIKQHS